MYISLNWLKDYIDLPKNLTAKKLAEDLTMSTVEVESIKNQAEEFENIVVGKILKLKKHPNADKLKIAVTEIGKNKSVQIICGGTNLKEKMFVAVALPGAKIRWHGEGESVVLEKAKIRGQESFGMICAPNEIGIENQFSCGEMEILDLSELKKIKPGQNLAQVLGFDDVIIEIENKSLTNRPDLWSHFGIARELSAIYKIPLKKLELFDKSKIQNPKSKINLNIKDQNLKINILDKNLCSRYIGCVVKNIKIEKSPDWLMKRLESVGSRSINNIVDITNYVMQDVGQPTHAFDKTLIHADKKIDKIQIIIRTAKNNEQIKTLDEEERKLDEEMLVVADAEKPIALAGIIGGANSEVKKSTTEIILESATFNAKNIRKTSQKLGLRTEASVRFEKNLDVNFAEISMLRMLKLIKEIIPQAEIVELVDEFPIKQKEINIKVEHKFLEKKIGQKIDSDQILEILERLGFDVKLKVKSQKSKVNDDILYKIKVPSWRATGDVSIPEDIVEEVARIYGFDNLKEKVEMIEMDKAKYQPEFDLENKIKNYLSLGCKMNEVFNYSWADEKILKSLGLDFVNFVEVENPPAQENRFLQTSLIPNLIKNVQDNLRYFSEFKLFELARVFKQSKNKNFDEDILPEQPKMFAGVVVGEKEDLFLEIKGIVEGILKDLRFKVYDLRIGKTLSFLDENKILQVFVNEKQIGWLGVLNFKIKNKEIGLFEINFEKLVSSIDGVKKFKQLPQFPLIERDLAIEIDWEIKWQNIKNEILKQIQDDIFNKIEFLSEFDLGNLSVGETGKKSVAFRIVYQASRTLKDKEVEVVENKIIKLLENKFNAKLRS